MKRIFLLCLLVSLLCAPLSCHPSRSEPVGEPPSTLEAAVEYNAYNPLTGLYTMASDRVGKRPFAVEIGNTPYSWPQSGTSKADVIVEYDTGVAVTQLQCLYADIRDIARAGPIRELRRVETVYAIDPVFVYFGTTILVDYELYEHGLDSLDAVYYPTLVELDEERTNRGYASWDNYFTSGARIQEALAAAGIREDSNSVLPSLFPFSHDETRIPEGESAKLVRFQYSGMDDGDFRYDEETGRYFKWQHGEPQTDEVDPLDPDSVVQLSFTNVVLVFANTQVDPNSLTQIDFQAGGEGYIFSGGFARKMTWQKPDFEAPMTFCGEDGGEAALLPGKTILCIARTEDRSTLTFS